MAATLPMIIGCARPVGTESAVVVDPDTGETAGRVPIGTESDVNAAVDAARRALLEPLPAFERSRILADAATAMAEREAEAARLISTEGVKTIREANVEAARCVETLRLSAEEAKRTSGETLVVDQHTTGDGRFGFWVREPRGVIGAITPFNDPLNLVAHKIGPALASGNSIVLKPDLRTPLSAFLLAEVLIDSGLPPGWLNLVTGHGRTVGAAIVRHPDVDMISYTGGLSAGLDIAANAGLKRVNMELGANNAAIVHHDADLGCAVSRITSGAFWAAGQNCLHVQRILVHSDVAPRFLDRFLQRVSRIRVGPKADPASDMGPLVDRAAQCRVQQVVSDAIAAGTEPLTGGSPTSQSFEPTILFDRDASVSPLIGEIYGPVSLLSCYDAIDEAVAHANAADTALAAAVFTRDLDVAMTAASRLRAGLIMVNDSTDFRIDAMPFGGFGSSGLGREGVRHAVTAMTEPKTVVMAGVARPGLG